MTGTQLANVENCRLRTRIKNNDGRIIYLELGGIQTHQYMPNKNFKNLGRIDHCFYEDVKEDKKANYSPTLQYLESINFEYTKENILKIVNEKLNCSFDQIEVSDDVRVHETKKELC